MQLRRSEFGAIVSRPEGVVLAAQDNDCPSDACSQIQWYTKHQLSATDACSQIQWHAEVPPAMGERSAATRISASSRHTILQCHKGLHLLAPCTLIVMGLFLVPVREIYLLGFTCRVAPECVRCQLPGAVLRLQLHKARVPVADGSPLPGKVGTACTRKASVSALRAPISMIVVYCCCPSASVLQCPSPVADGSPLPGEVCAACRRGASAVRPSTQLCMSSCRIMP